MPLSKDGSSFYLIVPSKCKYPIFILVVIVAIIVYQCFTYFNQIPFNKSPDPLTTLHPMSYNFSKHKVILITGGNTGIGKETAEILSLTGATVVIGSRSIKRGNVAKEDIVKLNKNIINKTLHIDVMALDLSSISSIDSFVTNFKSKYTSLDILICNAAVNPLEHGLNTKEGLETAFGTNHIGHMYLVLELKQLLTIHKHSRIIMVSAVPYEDTQANAMFDINSLNNYSQWDAYIMSKMENIMFCREFAKRFPSAHNNGLHIVSCHPGIGATDIFNKRDEHKDIIVPSNTIMMSIVNVLFQYFGDTLEQLSYTQLYLALTDIENLSHGGHFRNEDELKVFGGVVDNDRLCNELWNKSETIINDIKKWIARRKQTI